jgi:branched-chain amino acid transport system ATP-binding protein
VTLPTLRDAVAGGIRGPVRLREELRASGVSPRVEPSSARSDLVVSGLRVRYGEQVALHGVDVEVPAGSCVAVLGANGAGKTSLLAAISGLHRPVEGEIRFGSVRIDRRPAHRIGELGICHVPEGRGVFPNLSVAENLRLTLEGDEEKVEAALERFGRLRERLRQRAGTMSGGEQQMLAVAPAVVGGYRLLLVDELSLGLAPVVVDELFSVLADLRAAGTAMVIVEQFADRALELADHAYVLRKGTVAYRGAAAELQGNPDLLHRMYLGGS